MGAGASTGVTTAPAVTEEALIAAAEAATADELVAASVLRDEVVGAEQGHGGSGALGAAHAAAESGSAPSSAART